LPSDERHYITKPIEIKVVLPNVMLLERPELDNKRTRNVYEVQPHAFVNRGQNVDTRLKDVVDYSEEEKSSYPNVSRISKMFEKGSYEYEDRLEDENMHIQSNMDLSERQSRAYRGEPVRMDRSASLNRNVPEPHSREHAIRRMNVEKSQHANSPRSISQSQYERIDHRNNRTNSESVRTKYRSESPLVAITDIDALKNEFESRSRQVVNHWQSVTKQSADYRKPPLDPSKSKPRTRRPLTMDNINSNSPQSADEKKQVTVVKITNTGSYISQKDTPTEVSRSTNNPRGMANTRSLDTDSSFGSNVYDQWEYVPGNVQKLRNIYARPVR